MERQLVMAGGKCRRKYAPDNALFNAGNALRMNKFYHEAGFALSDFEDEKETASEKPPVFACRLFNCNGVGFHSLCAYEEHYDLVHRNICMECHRSFLSFRLLDIHLSETHDAFFRVLAKQKPMFVCLVDGCDQVFKHDDKRTKHLVNDHAYPTNFTFHTQRRQRNKPPKPSKETPLTSTGEERDAGAIKKAKALARKIKRRANKKQQLHAPHITNEDAKMEICRSGGDDDKDTPVVQTAEARAILHTEMADTIMEQAKEEDEGSATAGGDGGEVDNELVARMAQLQFVPKSISFGRRQQRRR